MCWIHRRANGRFTESQKLPGPSASSRASQGFQRYGFVHSSDHIPCSSNGLCVDFSCLCMFLECPSRGIRSRREAPHAHVCRRRTTKCRHLHAYIGASVYLSVRPSIRLSVRPSVRPSVHSSVRPSVRPSIRTSHCTRVTCPLCAHACIHPWDSLRGSSVNIGTIQRRLAWPLRKDDTYTSRSVKW